MKEGDRFGPWQLVTPLGEGGNATVWEATDDRGRRVALKLIKTTKANREPYRRFIAEIEFLAGLGAMAGIVPVVDFYLPETPSRMDRPWLVMELAQPIREALADAGLAEVANAVRDIATTLSTLAAEHRVSHRDIKPANLYQLGGIWCVGDFGLVSLPDRHELTQSGRPLGPAHFLADEMLRDPVSADPRSADVYSLGKTLWVLACRQNFPPQGHQPATTRGNLIADYAPHRHAAVLDRLVDRMTEIQPLLRPSMADVASELTAWASLVDGPLVIDLSQARSRLHKSLAGELSTADVAERQREHALAAVRRIQDLVRPLNGALSDLYPTAKIDQITDKKVDYMLETRNRQIDVTFRWARMSSVEIGTQFNAYALRMGRAVELTADGALLWHAFVDVGAKRHMGSEFHWQADERRAPVGSVTMDQMLEDAVRELAEALGRGAEAIADYAARRAQKT